MIQPVLRYCVMFAALVSLVFIQSQIAYAEGKKISGTGKVVALLSEAKVSSAGEPRHEISVIVRQDTDRNPDPDFDNAQIHHVSTSDCVAGNCTDKGYRTYTFRDGDRTVVAAYEGAIKTVQRPNGPPDITFEGKWWFTGGGGKFQGIAGGGTYKGQVTTAGATYSWDGEYEIKR